MESAMRANEYVCTQSSVCSHVGLEVVGCARWLHSLCTKRTVCYTPPHRCDISNSHLIIVVVFTACFGKFCSLCRFFLVSCKPAHNLMACMSFQETFPPLKFERISGSVKLGYVTLLLKSVSSLLLRSSALVSVTTH